MPKENRYRCINKVGSDPCLYAKERRVILETEAIPGLGGFCCPGKTDSGRDCRELLRKISEPVNGGSGGGEGKTVLDTIMEFLRSPIGLASIVVALLIIGGLLAWWRWGG
ncbi:MAG: hypothetical protein FWG59_00420, partial [Betaproteobacteria bacterium]|nr:hypothetical protein [Betaproteobacteria bacterium]